MVAREGIDVVLVPRLRKPAVVERGADRKRWRAAIRRRPAHVVGADVVGAGTKPEPNVHLDAPLDVVRDAVEAERGPPQRVFVTDRKK